MPKADRRTHAREVLTSGEHDEWYTPAPLLEVVREVGIIGLDPFWSAASAVRPLLGITKAQDSLGRDWLALIRWLMKRDQLTETPIAFCNPPYSIMEVVAPKITLEARQGVEVVTLVKAATETEWFEVLGWRSARAVCFLGSRLKHVNGDRLHDRSSGGKAPRSSATFASCLLYHGVRVRRFAVAAAKVGKVILLNGGA